MLDKALALAKAGRTDAANEIYDKLLRQKPANISVLRAVVQFHNRYSRQFRRAVPAVQRLLKARPKSAEAHALAAETYVNCARLPLAINHADQARTLAPDDADVLFITAFSYMAVDRFTEAMVAIDHALSLRPGHLPSLLQRGRALLAMGDHPAAAALCLEVMRDRPDDINFIGLYITAQKITPDDPVFVHMRDHLLAKYAAIGGQNLAHFLRLLGKAQDDQGDHDAAFATITRAKSLSPLPYDPKSYAQFVSTLCRQVSRADYFGKGGSDASPVLIVGMPRSGSSLLEQILASHPQIQSVGESPSLNVLTQDIGIRPQNGGDMVKAIKTIPPDTAAKLAARYLAETGREGALRTIDKSLHNFELLGFFAALLPKARIIHVKRDPMDTCVSCYMQNLSAWHRYSQRLETLGDAYVQYRRLMAHWKTALPNPILEVSYEDIVTDTKAVARRAVGFLGLEWDQTCLDFQNSPNTSQTLSTRQVREPLYTNAIQRWRRYETHLDPLKTALVSLYPDGFGAPAI